MLERLKRIIVVVGHYGSGKTNLAVNLAIDYRNAGKEVVLADLDIVNPYFRSADFAELLKQQGIELVAPVYAGTNLDIPAVTARLDSLLDTDKQVIIDVGGDDAGAAALGRYSALIAQAGGCEMLYVLNGYRYLTRTAEQAEQILLEIQQASRLSVSGVVNNSNLAKATTVQDILNTIPFAQQTAEHIGVPLLFTAVSRPLVSETARCLPEDTIYPVDIYIKKPWE
ncbi:MAG: ParA family protein [Anaerotruncus sp.]|nr:ParA family protein [Anaerotruncus sp.]